MLVLQVPAFSMETPPAERTRAASPPVPAERTRASGILGSTGRSNETAPVRPEPPLCEKLPGGGEMRAAALDRGPPSLDCGRAVVGESASHAGLLGQFVRTLSVPSQIEKTWAKGHGVNLHAVPSLCT